MQIKSFEDINNSDLSDDINSIYLVRQKYRLRIGIGFLLMIFIFLITLFALFKYISSSSISNPRGICLAISFFALITVMITSKQKRITGIKAQCILLYLILIFASFFSLSNNSLVENVSIIQNLPFITLALGIVILPFAFYADQQIQKFQEDSKGDIINKLFQIIDPSAKFEPTYKNQYNHLDSFGLFNDKEFEGSNFELSNKVTTLIGNSAFQFFSMKTDNVKKSFGRNSGILFIGKLNKAFKGEFLLKPNVSGPNIISEKIIGFINQENSPIPITNLQFEKHFKAFGFINHHIEDIISDDVADRILQIKEIIAPDLKTITIVQSMFNFRLCIKKDNVYGFFDFTKGKRFIKKEDMYHQAKLFNSSDKTGGIESTYDKLRKTYEVLGLIDECMQEWNELDN